jgi:type II secretory pathway pseudopilin PulG
MNARRPRTTGKRSERGYALLAVIFLVTVLLISTMVVAPNILTEGRREKEKEMIWRGKQYTRGVKLYYRKMGRFPTSLDDLTKPKVGSLHFMRQAYKDPMNKKDGSWRFIYVGPGGQLIGSLKPPQQNLQLPQAAGIGTPAGALNGPGSSVQPGVLGLLGGNGQPAAGVQPGQTGTLPERYPAHHLEQIHRLLPELP